MQLQIQQLRPYATIPTQATAGSAGYDLYAALEAPVSIPVGEIVRIPTGIAAAPDRKDVALFIMARSGLASKHGINLANGVGLVDPACELHSWWYYLCSSQPAPLWNSFQKRNEAQTDSVLLELFNAWFSV